MRRYPPYANTIAPTSTGIHAARSERGLTRVLSLHTHTHAPTHPPTHEHVRACTHTVRAHTYKQTLSLTHTDIYERLGSSTSSAFEISCFPFSTFSTY